MATSTMKHRCTENFKKLPEKFMTDIQMYNVHMPCKIRILVFNTTFNIFHLYNVGLSSLLVD
jgi:hypothetical protein